MSQLLLFVYLQGQLDLAFPVDDWGTDGSPRLWPEYGGFAVNRVWPRPAHFKELLGAAPGLPSDLASQHEHYRLGTPKR